MALIDTAGTLSLTRLRDVLVLRIHKESMYQMEYYQANSKYAKVSLEPDQIYDGFVRTADIMLNRVNYMRVFDLAGIAEAVDEVGESWEVQAQQTNEKLKAKDRVIEDSEEEDEANQGLSDENDRKTKETTYQQAGVQEGKAIGETAPIDMIVIDTISNVVTSVMSKSQVQGNFVNSPECNISGLSTASYK